MRQKCDLPEGPEKMCYQKNVLPEKMCYQKNLLPEKFVTRKICYQKRVLPDKCVLRNAPQLSAQAYLCLIKPRAIMPSFKRDNNPVCSVF